MMNMHENEDKLSRVDFGSMFPETPEAVRDAVRLAGADIRRRELARARFRRMAAVAAALLVVTAGATLAALRPGNSGHDGIVAAPVVVEYENSTLTEVYASGDDAYYHRDSDCPEKSVDAVGLPLITAREFDKLPCPVCGSR